MKKFFIISVLVTTIGWLIFEHVTTPSLKSNDFILNEDDLSSYLSETVALEQKTKHIRYFGFAITDCDYDDPTTAEVESRYFDEVKQFSNIGHVCGFSPDDNIQVILQEYKAASSTALLYVENILFERKPGGDKSGEIVSLRKDYAERFETFAAVNNLKDWAATAVLYLVDEPFWNSVSVEQLTEVSEYLEKAWPKLRQFTVLAYTSIGEKPFNLPDTVDWWGYYQYGVPNPVEHVEYRSDIDVLASSLNSQQKILIVFESMWLPQYRHYDFTTEHLPTMTAHYYRLAAEEQKVIGLVGYVWPNGFDGPGVLGARSLLNVHPIYQYIYDETIVK